MHKELVIFNGIVFTRYPHAKHRTNRMYYHPSPANQRRGIQALHREMWKAVHGPIPEGHDIHHRDENPLHNEMDNFECLPRPEHLELHRIGAVQWHQSDEGRRWHKKMARERTDSRPIQERNCDHCGKLYSTNYPRPKYCSASCNTLAHQKRIGWTIPMEQRDCVRCGKEFDGPKYSDQRFCTRSCYMRARWEEKKHTSKLGGVN